MWPNPQETANLVTFTKEILNEKLHILCSDLTAIGAYALWVTLLFHFLQEFIMFSKQICKDMTFADDFTVTRKVDEIKSYWNMLQYVGPLCEYFQFKLYLVD